MTEVDTSVTIINTDTISNAHLKMLPTAKQKADYQVIRFVARTVLDVIMHCWAFSGASILAILLLYWLYGGLLAFLLLCFATTGILYHAGDKLLYHPEQPYHSRVFVPTPSMFGLPFENIQFLTKDNVRLHAFFIKQPENICAQAVTIVYFHGNAGNIGHRLSNAQGLYRNLQCNILMVDYRGYGHSQGTPSESGLYRDGQASIDYLCTRTDIDHRKLVVFGRSLGGAVAIDVASRPMYSNRIACLIIENSFLSIPKIAGVLFNAGFIKYIPQWCYKNKFLSHRKVCGLTMPVLFVSGLSDALIPPRMMSELYQSCSSPGKRLVQLEGGSHNETWICPGYYHTLAMFIDDVLIKTKQPETIISEKNPLTG